MTAQRIRPFRCAAGAVAFVACIAAQAQDWPAKPIRIIVPTAPGGLMDVPARIAGEYLDRALGQRVLIENRSGASGNIGVDAVVRSAPDGYTLALIQLGNVAINPFLFRQMPHDPLVDLAPVAPLTSSPVVVAVNGGLPVSTLREFIDYAKQHPGKINHGGTGVGTVPHLAGELFARAAGVDFVHVQYRGAGPAVVDLVAGQVQVSFVGLGAVRTHVPTGKIKVLAVSQPRRLQSAPEIPTAEEAGLNGFEFTTWFGLAAPKGTSDIAINTLVRHVHAMQDDPSIQKRLLEGGMEVLKETPEQFRVRIQRDWHKFRDLVASIGIKPE